MYTRYLNAQIPIYLFTLEFNILEMFSNMYLNADVIVNLFNLVQILLHFYIIYTHIG